MTTQIRLDTNIGSRFKAGEAIAESLLDVALVKRLLAEGRAERVMAPMETAVALRAAARSVAAAMARAASDLKFIAAASDADIDAALDVYLARNSDSLGRHADELAAAYETHKAFLADVAAAEEAAQAKAKAAAEKAAAEAEKQKAADKAAAKAKADAEAKAAKNTKPTKGGNTQAPSGTARKASGGAESTAPEPAAAGNTADAGGDASADAGGASAPPAEAAGAKQPGKS